MFLNPTKMLEGDPVQKSKDISEWIKHDGFLIVLASILLLFGMVFMGIWLNNYYHSTKCSCHERRKPKDLMNHPFFGSMNLYLHTKVLTLSFPEKGREAIFRDFLTYKFDTFLVNTRQWLMEHTPHLEDMDPEALRNSLLIFITNGVTEYETKALREGIPDIVLKKFRTFHGPQVAQVQQNITNICECEWLLATNNIERVGFVLNVLEAAFEQTLISAELTLGDINGDLEGIVYKGITVKPFKNPKKNYHTGESGANPVYH